MRYEGVVDIFQTVKMLRTQRPAMVQTEVSRCKNKLQCVLLGSYVTEKQRVVRICETEWKFYTLFEHLQTKVLCVVSSPVFYDSCSCFQNLETEFSANSEKFYLQHNSSSLRKEGVQLCNISFLEDALCGMLRDWDFVFQTSPALNFPTTLSSLMLDDFIRVSEDKHISPKFFELL